MMMNFSDEILVAFVDGTLGEASRRAVEQAMLDDPVIAQRVAQHRASRAHVSAAFAPVPGARSISRMPARGGTVIQLALVRASKGQAPVVPASSRARWSWLHWGALAAMLVLGIVIGRFGLPLL
jgi:anti-sigma factor RsiW